MSILYTASMCATVVPVVVGTSISHYVNRKTRRNGPASDLSYELGVKVVRKFIKGMADLTVEDLQSLTTRSIPAPSYVKIEPVVIASSFSHSAAQYLIQQLGPQGLLEAGGSKWWQWREGEAALAAEWIEMRKDFEARGDQKSDRILLFVHGGAYYFGSVDEHRYQIQRHASKLKARAFAPRYRLAPQFPFPCGLHDCLAAYLFLLAQYDPSKILIAGDSAGGGMCTSLLVILRDQGILLPAGAILLSPWVDLTHSFPSICGKGELDYIPTQGFIHRPSIAWPPPRLTAETDVVQKPKDEVSSNIARALIDDTNDQHGHSKIGSISFHPSVSERLPLHSTPHTGQTSLKDQGFTLSSTPPHVSSHNQFPDITPKLELHDRDVYVQEQIQLYAPNHQLSNPLVSPTLNPSLGGLCPLFIQSGGGELLCDEQIYFAHKAANPQAYPTNPDISARWDPDGKSLNAFPPTKVFLQVWDDLCHVPHVLAWTKPAKFMYRDVAQFGEWALARAGKSRTKVDSNEQSNRNESLDCGKSLNTGSSPTSAYSRSSSSSGQISPYDYAATNVHGTGMHDPKKRTNASSTANRSSNILVNPVGPLPPFRNHMIRQRVDMHGNARPLEDPSMLASLKILPENIGIIKEAPVHRWLERQLIWEKQHTKLRAKFDQQRQRIEAETSLVDMAGEDPPATACVRRRVAPKRKHSAKLKNSKTRESGSGSSWWPGLNSKHDRKAHSSI